MIENQSAFPIIGAKISKLEDINSLNGLTKLEYFTAMAMNGLCANTLMYCEEDKVSKLAVAIAKETLEILEKHDN